MTIPALTSTVSTARPLRSQPRLRVLPRLESCHRAHGRVPGFRAIRICADPRCRDRQGFSKAAPPAGDRERALAVIGRWLAHPELVEQHPLGEAVLVVPDAGETRWISVCVVSGTAGAWSVAVWSACAQSAAVSGALLVAAARARWIWASRPGSQNWDQLVLARYRPPSSRHPCQPSETTLPICSGREPPRPPWPAGTARVAIRADSSTPTQSAGHQQSPGECVLGIVTTERASRRRALVSSPSRCAVRR